MSIAGDKMEFKDRSSYDDIFYSGGDKNRPNSRLDKKARNLIVVVIVLVLVLFLAVVLIWFFNFSSFADKPKTELPTVKIVDVIEEEEIKGTSEAAVQK
ncbi:MAG: hypothetical protein WCY53_04060, partial [Sphaerochaetaceae bacterium]